MKTLLRRVLIDLLILLVLPQLVPGFHISYDFIPLLTGSVVLTLLFLIVKPIIRIISFPINIATLGLFSLLINSFILFLLTFFVRTITVTAFSYHTVHIKGSTIPGISFSPFFAYLYTAIILSIIDGFLQWLL